LIAICATARIVTEETANWNPAAGDPAPRPDQDVASDVAGMTFEQALGELERIVQELERGQLDLDAAIKAYERGSQLKAHCSAKLREAQLRVERISLAGDGKVQTEPVDLE
jgi:exodeoxyribonuclease VII small subunit